ncbi:hypothetical protein OPV22_020091 [Ensete ventricosum]|uniref:RNA-directed DNA polymerase n=1 Tax=Ensete ventricosum TaxID=4639 RepID=A0AAV8QP04_ENSVE|nr:hypothetical protein OPV22_020091 [Ensete ventricosum]
MHACNEIQAEELENLGRENDLLKALEHDAQEEIKQLKQEVLRLNNEREHLMNKSEGEMLKAEIRALKEELKEQKSQQEEVMVLESETISTLRLKNNLLNFQLDLEIGGKRITLNGILDTRASTSVCDEKMIPKEFREEVKTDTLIKGVNGVSTINEILRERKIWIGQQYFRIPRTYVMPLTSGFHMIIGMNFIYAMEGVRIEKGEVTFYKIVTKTPTSPIVHEINYIDELELELPEYYDICASMPSIGGITEEFISPDIIQKMKKLGDTRWTQEGQDGMEDRSIIAAMEADLSQGHQLIYVIPDIMLTIRDFYQHIQISILTKGYRGFEGEANLLVTRSCRCRLTNVPNTGFAYNIEKVVEYLHSKGVKAIQAQKISTKQYQGTEWNIRPSEVVVPMQPTRMITRVNYDSSRTIRFLDYQASTSSAPPKYNQDGDSDDEAQVEQVNMLTFISENSDDYPSLAALEKIFSPENMVGEENDEDDIISTFLNNLTTSDDEDTRSEASIARSSYEEWPHIIKKITDMKDEELKEIKGLRKWLGILNYARSYIPNLGKTLGPLYAKTSPTGERKMNSQDWRIIRQVKEQVAKLPDLEIPPENAIMIIETDGCMEGWGGVCKWKIQSQQPRWSEKICAYASGKFQPIKSTIDAEVQAVINSLDKFKIYYLDKRELIIRTDSQAIVTFCKKISDHKPSRVRWLAFTDYITGTGLDIKFEHIDCKDNTLADTLSRLVQVVTHDEKHPAQELLISAVEEFFNKPNPTILDRLEKMLQKIQHWQRSRERHSVNTLMFLNEPRFRCGCGREADEITSHTSRNPERKYYTCLRKVCYTWVWKDQIDSYVQEYITWKN